MALALRALIAALALAGDAPLFASGPFYEDALPTLAELLKEDRLPARNIADLAHPSPPAAGAADAGDWKAEILRAAKVPAASALAAMEKLLPAARLAQSANGPGITNLLHDLRDLFASGKATTEERAEYLQWRIEHPEPFGFGWGKGNERERSEDASAVLAELEQRVATASPALKPHWLYLRGAVAFKSGNDTDSANWFQRVLAEYPEHPRAEAAQFMVARCLLSQSRTVSEPMETPGLTYHSHAELRAQARQAFEKYLAKFPQGRFAGDALGWLGAAAYDAEDYATATRFYVQQAELPDHPELAAGVADMGAKVLSRLAATQDDAQFAELAKSPVAALGLVYLIGNTSEANFFNGVSEEPAEVRSWRREILPRVARAIAANEALYRDASWRPRYLAMLVLAASGAGNQDEAIRLSELAGAAESEDLLLARGIALQRAKRAKDAAATFQQLIENFPASALRREVVFRRAFALFDDHRAGEALISLRSAPPPTAENNPEERDAVLTQLDPRQYRQLIDTIENFAPLPELMAGADTPGLDAEIRSRISAVIAQRLLAKEQFTEAKKYLPAAQWSLIAEKLEALTLAAQNARGPSQKAAACLALGEAWAKARGKLLTAPLDTEEQRRAVFYDDHAQANLLRQENAQAINASSNSGLELANRDELRHAFNWWLAASDAQPKTPVAAQALARALQAMPLIADVSPFHFRRASEQKWEEVSRALCERLRQENPNSEEARRLAVYWNFKPAAPPPAGDENAEKWRERELDENGKYDTPRGLAGQSAERWEGFNRSRDDEAENMETTVAHEILHLEIDAQSMSWEDLRAMTNRLQSKAHAALRAHDSSSVVNYIDDLATFFAEPDPGPTVRVEYVRLRSVARRLAVRGATVGEQVEPGSDEALRSEIAKAVADPQFAKIADYLAFLDCAVVANHIVDLPLAGIEKDGDPYTYRSRNYAELEKLARTFLAKFPRSRKREAALLLHAKALSRGMKPHVFNQGGPWPLGTRWEGGANPVAREQIPFDRAVLKGALNRYDKEFPQGRYAKEIRDFRGALAARTKTWKLALRLTIEQLDDAEKPSLQQPAGERLEAIFNELADENVRADLLAEIKAHPAARRRLGEMIEGGGGKALFAYMADWLRAQLAAR